MTVFTFDFSGSGLSDGETIRLATREFFFAGYLLKMMCLSTVVWDIMKRRILQKLFDTCAVVDE